MENNPFVRNIIIVGASDELISQLPIHLREKVTFYSQAEIDHHQAWLSKAGKLIHEPVYISIDKDVLRTQDAVTDWTNGDMPLLQLQAVLRIIYAHEKVIGVDITGECSATLDYLSEVKEASVNNKTNEELMQMILPESAQDGRGQQGFCPLSLLISCLRRFKPWLRREMYLCK